MLGWLAVGVVVNVAVAWGCALWSPLGELEFISHEEYGLRDKVDWLPDDFYIVTGLQQGFGLREISFQWHVPAP